MSGSVAPTEQARAGVIAHPQERRAVALEKGSTLDMLLYDGKHGAAQVKKVDVL